MTVKQTTAFLTSDNRVFANELEAQSHQHVLDLKPLIQKYAGDSLSRTAIEGWEEFKFKEENK
jgi:hypothetical protein